MANSFGDPFDQREKIRDAIDIVDLVERYVPLRRQGANFVGRCPWHDDSRPSLQVNATRQTFKCWVCNIGGDVFSFVMKIENVDFKESMQILADMAGIELVKPKRRFQKKIGTTGSNPRLKDETAVDAPEIVDSQSPQELPRQDVPYYERTNVVDEPTPKPVLYRSMEWLAEKYAEVFRNSPEAEPAREYARERGLSQESIEKYKIGYSPMEFDAVLSWIRYDRRRVKALEDSGTLAYREDYDERGRPLPRRRGAGATLDSAERRRYYDRFRGRLIFPIRDVQDRVVAFGGRLLPNTTLKSPAKYVNSPETPIFVKSKMVYGLDLARNAIRRTGKVLITEGYTDCIMASQFGFENVVAVLGTALGAEHVRILKRFADKMILLLDGDEAGQKRAKEVLRFFVEQGVDMSVLTLPDDDDPCEFLLEKGADAFRDALETKPVDALDHAFNAAVAGIDLESDVVGAAKALDSLLDVLALFPEERRAANDPARLRMIGAAQRFATRFRVSDDEIRRQLEEKRARAREYAERSSERERRYDEAAPDANAPQKIGKRERWTYPVAVAENETDDVLDALFPPFQKDVWDSPRLMPNMLESEYLEIVLAAPDLYPQIVAKIDSEELRSPVARQIDLVARDFLERGAFPTLENLMLRYEDERMRSYLVDLVERASEMKLAETLAEPESRDELLKELFIGFERAKRGREAPKQISLLRENELAPEDKLQTLMEIRERQLERQRRRDDEHN